MIKRSDKRGVDLMNSTIIFIILNVLFFGVLFFFVMQVGTNAGFFEQVYAKKIALVIDNAKPGTIISVNVNDFKGFIHDQAVSRGQIVSIRNNKVIIKLSKGEGYEFSYFNDVGVYPTYDEPGNDLILKLLIQEKMEDG